MLRRELLYYPKNICVTFKCIRIHSVRNFGTTQLFRSAAEKGIKNSNGKNGTKEVFTNLGEQNDPIRNRMFEYSWGTWLKNDEKEKQKRFTKFSLKGLNELVRNLQTIDNVKCEINNMGHSVRVITRNLNILDSGDKVISNVKQIVSIHEGKHHHVYKVVLTNGKTFVLRVPYRTMPEFYTERCLRSEAATSYYLEKRLGLHVPKLIAYCGNSDNFLESPFILSEYKKGDLLMRNWDPIMKGKLGDKSVEEKLSVTIDPIFNFLKNTASHTFLGYGSLYFKGDISKEKQLKALKDDDLFVLGPTTLRCYYRACNTLDNSKIDKYRGPWPADSPLRMIKDLSSVIIQSLREKELSEANNTPDFKKAISVYESLGSTSENLLDLNKSSIPNFGKLIKPRLYIPDLDPMNVVVSNNKENSFIDFEGATAIPFILSSAPTFVEYSGPKIFDLNEIVDFDKLSTEMKAKFEYMQKRTRNQAYWEKKIVKEMHDLASSAAPVVKMIRDPFICVVKNHTPEKEYFSLAGSLFMLKQLWKRLREDHIVDDIDCPIKLPEDKFDQFAKDYEAYQKRINSAPFAITGGWVPQDIFERLRKQGVIIKDGENWKVKQQAKA